MASIYLLPGIAAGIVVGRLGYTVWSVALPSIAMCVGASFVAATWAMRVRMDQWRRDLESYWPLSESVLWSMVVENDNNLTYMLRVRARCISPVPVTLQNPRELLLAVDGKKIEDPAWQKHEVLELKAEEMWVEVIAVHILGPTMSLPSSVEVSGWVTVKREGSIDGESRIMTQSICPKAGWAFRTKIK